MPVEYFVILDSLATRFTIYLHWIDYLQYKVLLIYRDLPGIRPTNLAQQSLSLVFLPKIDKVVVLRFGGLDPK